MSPRSPHCRPPSDSPRPLTQRQVKKIYCPVTAVASKEKHGINGLSHRVSLEVIRSLEKVEIPQVTAEPQLEELHAEVRQRPYGLTQYGRDDGPALSLPSAVRQRPYGLTQYGRDDGHALAKYQRDDPQIYPTSKSRKEKNTCKGDLEGVDLEFLPSPPVCDEVPYKLSWKVAPREILRQKIQRNTGFPPSSVHSTDLEAYNCGSQTQVLL